MSAFLLNWLPLSLQESLQQHFQCVASFPYLVCHFLSRPPLTLEESLQRLGVEVQLVDTTPDAADHRIRDEMQELLKNLETLRRVGKGGRRGAAKMGPGE